MLVGFDLQQGDMHRLGVQIAIDRSYNLHNFKFERKRRRVPGVRIGVRGNNEIVR